MWPYNLLTINKTIDSAFVDRADIVQFIDLPTKEAMYEILRTCLCEIITKGIVAAVASSWPQPSST